MIKRIFPFDSGAFLSGKYQNFFDEDSSIDDYTMGENIEILKKLVSCFYRNNSEYFHGQSSKNVNIPFEEFEAAGVHELARLPSDPSVDYQIPLDERTSSFEIQLSRELPLRGNVKGILLPEKCLDVKNWLDAIKRWGKEYTYTYSTINSLNPNAFAGIIYAKIEDIFKEMGYEI